MTEDRPELEILREVRDKHRCITWYSDGGIFYHDLMRLEGMSRDDIVDRIAEMLAVTAGGELGDYAQYARQADARLQVYELANDGEWPGCVAVLQVEDELNPGRQHMVSGTVEGSA
jgi:hypothetical protein